MITITYQPSEVYEPSRINNIWKTEMDNPEELYKKHMIYYARNSLNLIINPHWLNAMDFKNNNSHLEEKEYKSSVKSYNKYKSIMTFDKYIKAVLCGEKLEFKESYL